ncbi:hypothetical protein V2J09_012675 [Rumex salicifolius]
MNCKKFLGAPSMASIIRTKFLLLPLLHHHLLLLLLTFVEFRVITCDTNPEDTSVLQSLMNEWENTPPSWRKSDDPCGFPWDGVTCDGGDIGGLKELRILDLSFNKELTGSLSPELGQLTKLNILILAGCGFSGSIPSELGQLSELTFLALNSNKLSGEIPASLGNLTKIYWFDLGDNQLTGTVPVSNDSSPGLDIHFSKNQLSGSIPPSLFRPEMILIHVLFDGNRLTGPIPSTIALVQTLEVLRLDRNQLSGEVPSNLNNLTKVNELDLSNNQFDESDAPDWFATLIALTTLVVQNGSLQGSLPEELFSFPALQQVKLRNNNFSTLFMGTSLSQQLDVVDLQHNHISSVTLGSYNFTLMLMDNPICSNNKVSQSYCRLQQEIKSPYSTSLTKCGMEKCSKIDQKLSPQSCNCVYPYQGILYFRGPSFRDLTNATVFRALEMDMWTKFELAPGSVSLQNLSFNEDDYLQINLELFPVSGEMYFSRSEVLRFGFKLTNHTYKPPNLGFGPYYFLADPYIFPDMNEKSGFNKGLILGMSIVGVLLVLVLVSVGVYVVLRKKHVERATGLNSPFASWASSGKDNGGVPQLKGARLFTYDELKQSTNNFSSINEIGGGGYGKVYKGVLLDGQLVAVKRAKQGSMQGGLEFKTEIELLSRVHHKNLVGLVGFCFEQGEQILVYEFMPNGSGYLDPEYYLTNQLTEKSDVYGFGVVMLELLTAKPPIVKGKYVVREVRTAADKTDHWYGLRAMLDPAIMGGLVWLRGYVDLALHCTVESSPDRPTMSEVVKAIEIMLHDVSDISGGSSVAYSSITDSGASMGASHPYHNDALASKKYGSTSESEDPFECSSSYSFSWHVEPK